MFLMFSLWLGYAPTLPPPIALKKQSSTAPLCLLHPAASPCAKALYHLIRDPQEPLINISNSVSSPPYTSSPSRE